MNTLKLIASRLFIIIVCFGCSTTQRTDKDTKYFKSFNLFSLSGLDTVAASDIADKQNREFVEVNYRDNLPYSITYQFTNRKVVLTLDTCFKVHDRDIFVYYTGNLLGGKAGKQREYSFHYIDNGYKLYINLSDTILVKSYDNIDIRSGDRHHYMLDIYTQKHNQVSRYSLLQGDTRSTIRDDSLFKNWDIELNKFKPQVISAIGSFPPN